MELYTILTFNSHPIISNSKFPPNFTFFIFAPKNTLHFFRLKKEKWQIILHLHPYKQFFLILNRITPIYASNITHPYHFEAKKNFEKIFNASDLKKKSTLDFFKVHFSIKFFRSGFVTKKHFGFFRCLNSGDVIPHLNSDFT